MMHLLMTGILALSTPPVQPPPPAPQEAVAGVEPGTISGTSFRQQVQDGQLAMEQGRWEDAAAAFESAQTMLDAPLAELTYNKAVADYRRGEYQLASEGFTNAIAQGTSPELHRDAAYNLGNSAHSRVVESLQSGNAQDAQAALDQLSKAQEELKGALEHYRHAIRTHDEDADARANAELTWNLIEQLRDMEEQLKEQQQQQDQQQQDQQQGQQQQDQEQNQQQQDQQQQDQQQQDQQQQDQQQQQQDQQQQDQQQQDQQQQDQQQQDQQQQDQQQQDQQQQDQQGQSGSEREEQLKDALDEIQQAQQELEDARKQLEEELERNPANERAAEMKEQVEQAQEELDQLQEELEQELEQEESENGNQDGSAQEPDAPGEEEGDPSQAQAPGTPEKDMSRDEAQRLLQGVRDKERQRRKARAEAAKSGTAPGGKDW